METKEYTFSIYLDEDRLIFLSVNTILKKEDRDHTTVFISSD